ncbi:MAG: glycosyltransferase family 2 protein [Patescibacteria group bacterium]
MIDLSVIIVNYKTPKLTEACVSSVKKHPPKVSYEIIVIDNSFDNVGFAGGNNKGIKKAKGKYILLLNSDTEVKKGSIDRLLEFAKYHEDAGVVAPKLLNPDGSVQASVFRFPTFCRAIQQYFLKEKGLLDKYVPNTNIVEVAIMAAYLITPTCLKKVGLLNEKYFMYFEDFDYARKIKKANLKIYYLKNSEVIHHHGASGISLAENKDQWKRLIPSSKIYHGTLGHYLINAIIWLGQKWVLTKKILFG